MKHLYILIAFCLFGSNVMGQTSGDELEKLMADDTKPGKEFVKNAFKSSRVINGHSMEMIGKGVLDFRILHRFGTFKSGIDNFFGLDEATMRMGFDYGVTKNLTIGVGRSTFRKEYDGFVKYRFAHQHTGTKAFPISLVWVSGITMNSSKFDPKLDELSNRLSYYHQLIAGRKFSESFSFQLSPTLVHQNLVEFNSDYNNMIAVGIGGRLKISKRSAILIDTYPIVYGASAYQKIPISIGFDIETGGHVFQLHITNAKGMNERAFIAETIQDWGKGEIQFGFNLSRVFTVVKNKEASW